MKNFKKTVLSLLTMAVVAFGLIGCEGEDGMDGVDGVDGAQGPQGPQGPAGEDGDDLVMSQSMFENKSNLDPLVSISSQFNFVKAYSLISTTDTLGGFQLAGAADGAGFLRDNDGYVFLVNCEDDYAVARIRLDANLNPIEGDYLLNSGVADFARQCSATMWESEIHGGAQDLFLSASESFNYDIKGIDPFQVTPTPTADFGLDALGEYAWENAVPLPQDRTAPPQSDPPGHPGLAAGGGPLPAPAGPADRGPSARPGVCRRAARRIRVMPVHSRPIPEAAL